MSNNSTTGFGLTTWDEKNQTQPLQNNQQEERLPFIRLNDGANHVRIITPPAKFWHIKYADGNSRYGKRVYCAYPSVPKEECPTVQAGYKPKKRYLCGAIHRTDEGPIVGILDVSVLVYEQIQNIKSDEEYGSPENYDLNIRYNKKASSAQGYYTVLPRQKKPLSEEDIKLIESVGMERIESNLMRLCTPRDPEWVRNKLISMGWDGESKADISNQNKNGVELEETSDDDYNFDRPPSATAAE